MWKDEVEVGSEADVDAALTRPKQRGKVDFVKIADNRLKPDLFLYAQRRAKAPGVMPVAARKSRVRWAWSV